MARSISMRLVVGVAFLVGYGLVLSSRVSAQDATLVDPELQAQVYSDGLTTPIGMAFIGANDLLVLEKNTGQVKRITSGVLQGTVLDLAVNFASERGLLGIALDPDFDTNGFVYLYWTGSSTGSDVNDLAAVSLLGNRVDRFVWDGATLTFDQNLVQLRALQEDGNPVPPGQGDEGQPPRGNHDGGVITFGSDGRLYIFIGDVGRRGALQNLPCGPSAICPGVATPDDQFGGPNPDQAHLTGVVLRLNGDGSTPVDNPFYGIGAALGGETGAVLQKIYTYGHRNGFGIAVDPLSGHIWLEENGDDSFSEINRLFAGMNGGWIQFAGPASRIAQFKDIETTFGAQALQQLRWPPTNIAGSAADATARSYMLPGATYSDPEFSWKWEVAPAGMGFMNGTGLGSDYEGDLFVGAATPNLEGGYLFRFNLAADRLGFDFDDPLLDDLVADNVAKHDITESESLLFGSNFGVVTDIETGPNGNLFVLSLSQGKIYEISRQQTADTTPPSCGTLTRIPASGTITAMEFTATDPESGIAAVYFQTLLNAYGSIDGAGMYAQGNTVNLSGNPPSAVVRGTRITAGQKASVVTVITNGAGLSQTCDPVVASVSTELPLAFRLEQNYPNPFSRETVIRYDLPESAPVRLEVYDIMGRQATVLVDSEQSAGTYEVRWDGTDSRGDKLAGGVYLVRLKAGSFVQTYTMTMLD